jgi:hypothetical protein
LEPSSAGGEVVVGEKNGVASGVSQTVLPRTGGFALATGVFISSFFSSLSLHFAVGASLALVEAAGSGWALGGVAFSTALFFGVAFARSFSLVVSPDDFREGFLGPIILCRTKLARLRPKLRPIPSHQLFASSVEHI